MPVVGEEARTRTGTGEDSFRRLGGFGKLAGEGGDGRVLEGWAAGVGEAFGVVPPAALPERR